MGEEAVVAGDEGFGFFLGDALLVSAGVSAVVLWGRLVVLRLLLLSSGGCGGESQEEREKQSVHGCGIPGWLGKLEGLRSLQWTKKTDIYQPARAKWNT